MLSPLQQQVRKRLGGDLWNRSITDTVQVYQSKTQLTSAQPNSAFFFFFAHSQTKLFHFCPANTNALKLSLWYLFWTGHLMLVHSLVCTKACIGISSWVSELYSLTYSIFRSAYLGNPWRLPLHVWDGPLILSDIENIKPAFISLKWKA